MLYRERQTQLPEPTEASPQHKDTPAKVEEEVSRVSSGTPTTEEQSTMKGDSAEVAKSETAVSEVEPMETQPVQSADLIDDEQPKSKLKTVPHGSHGQSNISKTSQPRQTTAGVRSSATSAAVGGDGDDDLPYFPAHPISYFPDDTEPSASVAGRQPPHQQTKPQSMFDQQFSLFAISEDEPAILTLEPFKVSYNELVKGRRTFCNLLYCVQFPEATSMPQSKSIPQSPPKVYDVSLCKSVMIHSGM